MDIMRCVLAGVASLVVGVVLLAFGGVATLIVLSRRAGHHPIGIDFASLARSPIVWIVALALFAVGFIGEYRRSV